MTFGHAGFLFFGWPGYSKFWRFDDIAGGWMKRAIAYAVRVLRQAGYCVQVRMKAESRECGAFVQTPRNQVAVWWSSQRLLRRAAQMQTKQRVMKTDEIAVGQTGRQRNDAKGD